MKSVFESKDYKEFIQGWLSSRPKAGRGEARRMAEKLSVSTTLISQVINGDKHFTMEAASDLCDHLGLSERETDHFLLLVDYARAGTSGLKLRIRKRLERSREEARKITERLERDHDLTDVQAAVYYSHWVYTGLTNWIATKPNSTVDEMAERLKVPPAMITRVLSFLLESGLLMNRGGHYEVGVKRILMGPDSHLTAKQHQNWRIRGFNEMVHSGKQNFFFTMPMSLSREIAERIRDDLPAYIEKIGKWVGPSESEVVRCLNIDWFEY